MTTDRQVTENDWSDTKLQPGVIVTALIVVATLVTVAVLATR
jgi:preprotein translocase subunit Sec61beta